jgi:hypothetical protein
MALVGCVATVGPYFSRLWVHLASSSSIPVFVEFFSKLGDLIEQVFEAVEVFQVYFIFRKLQI